MDDPNNNISAFAFVHPNAILGTGNVVMEGAIIREGCIIGDNNYFGPYCIIGEVPEKKGFFDKPGKVEIGNGNRFEKFTTVDSGTERPTIIHDNVIMLRGSHVGHDVEIKSGAILSCNVLIGGHTVVGENTNFGLGAVAHQRLQIPDGCMIGMNSTITKKTVLEPLRKYAGSPAKDIGANVRDFSSH